MSLACQNNIRNLRGYECCFYALDDYKKGPISVIKCQYGKL